MTQTIIAAHTIMSPNNMINVAPPTLIIEIANTNNSNTMSDKIIKVIIILPPFFHKTVCEFREKEKPLRALILIFC